MWLTKYATLDLYNEAFMQREKRVAYLEKQII